MFILSEANPEVNVTKYLKGERRNRALLKIEMVSTIILQIKFVSFDSPPLSILPSLQPL